MPIDAAALDAIARVYVAAMTSIRGRRVHRLLVRELGGYDRVFPVTMEDGASAVFAISDDGSAALCRSDGRGPSADVARWRRLSGATVTTAFDLLHDSLPIVSWTIWHPAFARLGGALTISAGDVASDDRAGFSDVLHLLSGPSRGGRGR